MEPGVICDPPRAGREGREDPPSGDCQSPTPPPDLTAASLEILPDPYRYDPPQPAGRQLNLSLVTGSDSIRKDALSCSQAKHFDISYSLNQ
eukprot:756023-Hanusia_phi.AAC.10